MSESLLGGIMGIALLVIINIVLVAFSYGRLSQSVSDLCRRMDRVEKIINNSGEKEKGR